MWRPNIISSDTVTVAPSCCLTLATPQRFPPAIPLPSSEKAEGYERHNVSLRNMCTVAFKIVFLVEN